MFAKALVETPHRLNTSLMSPLNKLQELQSITVALALPLPLPLALTASVTPHFSRKLFTELKELQLISSDSCAPTVYISRALTLIPARASTPPTKEPFKRPLKAQLGSPDFGSSGALRTTPTGSHPRLLLREVSHRLLPFIVSNTRSIFGTGRTPGSHHTLFAASLLCKTIV